MANCTAGRCHIDLPSTAPVQCYGEGHQCSYWLAVTLSEHPVYSYFPSPNSSSPCPQIKSPAAVEIGGSFQTSLSSFLSVMTPTYSLLAFCPKISHSEVLCCLPLFTVSSQPLRIWLDFAFYITSIKLFLFAHCKNIANNPWIKTPSKLIISQRWNTGSHDTWCCTQYLFCFTAVQIHFPNNIQTDSLFTVGVGGVGRVNSH